MIYQFQIFRAVYEEGGFSKGSKRLGLTQSAVSQQIKSLEENLKTPLFNENDRSTPSLAGEFLYRESGKILAGIEDIKNGISNLKNIIRGKITFGMIDVAAISLLPKTLKLFKNKFPEVQMEAKVKPSGELMQMVDNYQLDFCISVIHNLMSDHEFNVIYKDSIVAVVEKNSPIAKKKEVCIDDLKGEPLILYPSASYSRKL
ncbi:LysR family transcriptional regulator, partial [bacterium]|nr:LysR family transcriptional regulator [bacterium]